MQPQPTVYLDRNEIKRIRDAVLWVETAPPSLKNLGMLEETYRKLVLDPVRDAVDVDDREHYILVKVDARANETLVLTFEPKRPVRVHVTVGEVG